MDHEVQTPRLRSLVWKACNWNFSLSRAFWYILKPWTWYSFSGSEPLYAAKPARATDTAGLSGPAEPYSSACLHGCNGKTSHAFPATSTNIDTTTDSDHSIISVRNQRKFYSDRSLYPLHTPSTDQPWLPANCLLQGIHLLKQSFPLVINGPLHMDTGMLWVRSCLNWRAWPSEDTIRQPCLWRLSGDWECLRPNLIVWSMDRLVKQALCYQGSPQWRYEPLPLQNQAGTPIPPNDAKLVVKTKSWKFANCTNKSADLIGLRLGFNTFSDRLGQHCSGSLLGLWGVLSGCIRHKA